MHPVTFHFKPIVMNKIQSKFEETFTVKCAVNMETSFGVIDKSDSEELEVTVKASLKRQRGSFEIYDIKTGGERFYGEGGLWFSGITLVDYDGVFALSQFVIEKLEEWGFDCDDVS